MRLQTTHSRFLVCSPHRIPVNISKNSSIILIVQFGFFSHQCRNICKAQLSARSECYQRTDRTTTAGSVSAAPLCAFAPLRTRVVLHQRDVLGGVSVPLARRQLLLGGPPKSSAPGHQLATAWRGIPGLRNCLIRYPDRLACQEPVCLANEVTALTYTHASLAAARSSCTHLIPTGHFGLCGSLGAQGRGGRFLATSSAKSRPSKFCANVPTAGMVPDLAETFFSP